MLKKKASEFCAAAQLVPGHGEAGHFVCDIQSHRGQRPRLQQMGITIFLNCRTKLPLDPMPKFLVKHRRYSPKPLEGAALVIVLSCLVLLAALALGLLARVESDRINSSAYRGSTLSRNLAEYAINVVMTQISAATKADPTLAWASQPGAIRTYSATGPNLVNIYKLYSSPVMVANTFPSGDTALTGWSNNPALYTDLNAPVVSGNGANVSTRFPILDPRSSGVVQGFAISAAPNATTLQPAPMPVTWLYVLEDGTLAAPTDGGSANTVTVSPAATAANPIVGRIAFWTDDDTSKVNINTASGAPWDYTNATVFPDYTPPTTMPANYWDTPIIGSGQDVNLAVSQPWSGEYQRFPGHPATISLSAVFPSLSTNQIMDIAPRINYEGGGSRWGSVVNPGAARLTDDAARLYANVDELLFATNRSASGTNSFTQEQLDQGRFFLTASSRSPDVTLFNTPRLLIWPVDTASNKQTPFDRLIAFCGTVGTNSYYFQRTDAYSPTTDYNLARNQTLLGYFRRMTTQAVPGFGGASGILGKYNVTASGESEQISTEIFDYVRGINLKDTTRDTASAAANNANYYSPNGLVVPTAGADGTRGFGRFPTVTKVGMIFWYDKESVTTNSVVPETTTTNTLLSSRLILETFIPAHGYPKIDPLLPNLSVEVSGLTSGGGFQWGNNATNMTSIFSSDTATYSSQAAYIDERPFGGRRDISTLSGGATNTGSPAFSTNAPAFPTNALATFNFTGGNITIKTTYGGHTIQTINNINLPDVVGLPIPTPVTSTVGFNSSAPASDYNGQQAWTNRDTRAKNSHNALILTNDVVRSVQIGSGDFRMVAAGSNPLNGAAYFTNHPNYFNTNPTNSSFQTKAHSFVRAGSYTYFGSTMLTNGYYSPSDTNTFSAQPGRNPWVNADMITPGLTASGDFDNGYGEAGDGPFIGFADEGVQLRGYFDSKVPYLNAGVQTAYLGPGLYSPNRLVPSAGILGSLPTGVLANQPWQTLLFRPEALTISGHPGANNPPDYLLLDLFNMPVVEPYAISEPLSTAGRVNMNYQILPFTYIQRSTAVQAALHTEWMLAIRSSLATDQKRKGAVLGEGTTRNSRYPLDLPATLQGFENRFAANDLFRSAAEICSLPLVPVGSTWNEVNNGTFWSTNTLTGDNSKERPYARIYPKLTTKSNTYTVHYRVEVLKKKPNSAAATWTEGQDKVLSTYRGSTTIERYVTPGDPALPDYASMAGLPPTGVDALPNFYKFRIVGELQFNP